MSCRDLPRQVMLRRKLPTRTGDFSELVDSNLPVTFLGDVRFFSLSETTSYRYASRGKTLLEKGVVMYLQLFVALEILRTKHFGNPRRALA